MLQHKLRLKTWLAKEAHYIDHMLNDLTYVKCWQ